MSEQKILHLTLKKKWFDMILSGDKKEEYREVKNYWIHRLTQIFTDVSDPIYPIVYSHIVFKNGYGKNAPEVIIECKGISIGYAKPEWSDNWQGDVFVIKLGEIISTINK